MSVKFRSFEIAKNQAGGRFGNAPFDVIRVNEPIPTVRCFGTQSSGWQSRQKRAENANRIYHRPFPYRGMCIDPFNGDFGTVGRKSFRIDFVSSRSVECVGNMSTQFRQIKLIRSTTNLFIAREAESDDAMLQFFATSH